MKLILECRQVNIKHTSCTVEVQHSKNTNLLCLHRSPQLGQKTTLWHTRTSTVSDWTNPTDVGRKAHSWFLWSQSHRTTERPVTQSATRGSKTPQCWARWSVTTSCWDCPKRKIGQSPLRSKWVYEFLKWLNSLSLSLWIIKKHNVITRDWKNIPRVHWGKIQAHFSLQK